MSKAARACYFGDPDYYAYQGVRAEAEISRRFRTAVPILVADDDLKDLGTGQCLGLGLALGLGTWALIGFVLGVAARLGTT
jgi:hypothetical protein